MVIYTLAYPDHRAEDPLVRSFRDFLIAEAAAENTLPNRPQEAAE